MLPLEVWQIIFDHADFLTQIRLKRVCHDFYHTLRITNLYNILEKYLRKLTDSILKSYPYVKKLDAGGLSQITDAGIKHLDLCVLNARNNFNIKNISHLVNLEILYATHFSGIDDNSLTQLKNLKKLSVSNNPKITNLNHLSNLETLIANDIYCGIDDDGIKKLNLKKLDCTRNPKITDVKHMTKLDRLIIDGYRLTYDMFIVNDKCLA